MLVRTVLLAILVAFAIVFIVQWRRAVAGQRVRADPSNKQPTPIQVAIGFVTDFFDTLGIGSFATTTTIYKLLRVVPDEKIVGTMLVGHSLPVVVQALIFIVAVQVDPAVLASLIAISVVGSWIGAGVASHLPRRPIQITMGVGLLAAIYPNLTLAIDTNDPAEQDIVVNATPLGMHGDDPLPVDCARLEPGTWVGDVVMSEEMTPFLIAAQARGCPVQVGIEMLFEQIPAYLEFFGFPTTTPEYLRHLAGQAPASTEPR